MSNDDFTAGYSILRTKWHAEDELINHRVTWLLVSQGLLFSAYAALYYARATALAPISDLKDIDNIKQTFPIKSIILENIDCDLTDAAQVIPIIGIATALAIWLSISGAVVAMGILHKNYDNIKKNAVRREVNLLHVESLGVSAFTSALGVIAPITIPPVFCITWGFVLHGTQKFLGTAYCKVDSFEKIVNMLIDSRDIAITFIIVFWVFLAIFRPLYMYRGNKAE
jgi:hypothetical protein